MTAHAFPVHLECPWPALIGSLAVLLLASLTAPLHGAPIDVWIGTTTSPGGTSQGVYHLKLDSQTGALTPPELAAELDSPGFLALHPDGKHVYSVCSIDGSGSVAAFQLLRENGEARLQLINSQSIGDGGATHLCTDHSGRVLMTAQYGAGSVAVFPLQEDGKIGPRSQLIKHQGGSGVVSNRQDSPHPHWIGTDAGNRFVFVPDLGLDQIVIYALSPAEARLQTHGHTSLPGGSGPRHMKFHPHRPLAYVLNEMSLTVTGMNYDAQAGTLTPFQTVEALPGDLQEVGDSASEIRIHPSGRFLYTGNRGHDSITVFRIHDDGQLSFVEREAIRGSWPRNFNVTPDGQWLLAAGRDSSTLAVFRITPDTGELVYTRHIVNVPTPICVLFSQP